MTNVCHSGYGMAGNSMLIIWHDPPWRLTTGEDTYNERDIWHDKEMMRERGRDNDRSSG